MNYATIILIVFYLIISILFFFKPLIVVAESLLAMVLAFFVTVFGFNSILAFFVSLGIRENIYAPSLIFIFSQIIIWAVFFTLFSMLISVGQLTRSYKAGFLLFILSAFFCIVIGSVVCLSITPFVQSQKIIHDLNDCRLCKLARSLSNILPSLDGQLSEISLDVYMPKNEEGSIDLSSDFEISGINLEKSRSVFGLINESREKVSLPPLDWDEDLNKMAIEYGQEMSETKFFAHKNIEGRTAKERAEALGINFDYLGENLAIAPEMQQAHQVLLDSESHYKNIVSPVFKRGAVAVFDLKNGFVMLIEQFSN